MIGAASLMLARHQAVDQVFNRVQGLTMASDQNSGSVALDVDMDRFGLAFAQESLRLLPHQIEHVRDQLEGFLGLFVEAGAAASRAAFLALIIGAPFGGARLRPPPAPGS